jgi:hypothetical protein
VTIRVKNRAASELIDNCEGLEMDSERELDNKVHERKYKIKECKLGVRFCLKFEFGGSTYQ